MFEWRASIPESGPANVENVANGRKKLQTSQMIANDRKWSQIVANGR